MVDKERQELKESILNRVICRANEYMNYTDIVDIDEESLRKICFAGMLRRYEKEEQEQGAKVLCEIKLRAKERIGGLPIDVSILKDICDSIRDDNNI